MGEHPLMGNTGSCRFPIENKEYVYEGLAML